MREIKFRAWNKQCRCEGCGDFTSWERLKKITYGHEEDNIWNDGDYILEQFTGLHDKNGKEIYEGDIVKVPYNYIGKVVVEWKKNGRWGISDYNITKLSVVGNIHENPELISND